MISKTGKLRSLVRELKKNYAESATTELLVGPFHLIGNYERMISKQIYEWVTSYSMFLFVGVLLTRVSPSLDLDPSLHTRTSSRCRCLKNLELQIKNVDSQYDLCNEAWAKGEVEDFQSEAFFGWSNLNSSGPTFSKPGFLTFFATSYLVVSITNAWS